jgi:hypothetical protein
MHLASIDTEEENKLLQETIADQGLSTASCIKIRLSL